MPHLRPLIAGWLPILLSACFEAVRVEFPEPPPNLGAVLYTVTERQGGETSALLLSPDAYRREGLPNLAVSDTDPVRVWLEFLAESPEDLRVEPGPVHLVDAQDCGVRTLPRGLSSFRFEPAESRFLEEPRPTRPELRFQTPCPCPAPTIEEFPLDDQCLAQPLTLLDGRVMLVFTGGDNCGTPTTPRDGFAIFDPATSAWSAITTIAESLFGSLLLPDGRVLWGAGDLAGLEPTQILELEPSGALRVLSSTPSVGRVTALVEEARGRSLLVLVRPRASDPSSVSRLYRVELEANTWTLLVPYGDDQSNTIQADVLLRLGEEDVLAFPRNSQTWFRVQAGRPLEAAPPFEDLGRVRAGVVSPVYGGLVGTRSGALLRLDGSEFVPLPFERDQESGSGLEAVFLLRGSVGFMTRSGLVRLHHPEEPRCPGMIAHPNLDNPIVAMSGDRVVLTGTKRETERAALYLITATD